LTLYLITRVVVWDTRGSVTDSTSAEKSQPCCPCCMTPLQYSFHKPPSRNGKGWDRPSPSRLLVATIRFYPDSLMISSSESSLLEERTPEKRPYYDVYVTPRRARRPSCMIHRETASRCVFLPSGTFKLITEPGKTRPHNGGWAGSLFGDC
jgi:hypothetical protein